MKFSFQINSGMTTMQTEPLDDDVEPLDGVVEPLDNDVEPVVKAKGQRFKYVSPAFCCRAGFGYVFQWIVRPYCPVVTPVEPVTAVLDPAQRQLHEVVHLYPIYIQDIPPLSHNLSKLTVKPGSFPGRLSEK